MLAENSVNKGAVECQPRGSYRKLLQKKRRKYAVLGDYWNNMD